jgi:hypothetical protein
MDNKKLKYIVKEKDKWINNNNNNNNNKINK